MHNEECRVVIQPIAVVCEDGPTDPPHDVLRRQLIACGLTDEVDQLVQPEPAPALGFPSMTPSVKNSTESPGSSATSAIPGASPLPRAPKGAWAHIRDPR